MANWLRICLLWALLTSPSAALAVDYASTNVLESLSEATLREAVTRAQTSGVPTKITYDGSGNISLAQRLVVEGTVWIDLPGTVFTSGGRGGAFLISSNGNARLSGITVSNVRGGTNAVLLNEGTLEIENCVFEENTSQIGSAGAIANLGTLTIRGTRISQNSSTGEGQIWGWPTHGSRTGAGGGIQQNGGMLRIFDTIIESNKTSMGYITSTFGDGTSYGSSLGGGLFVSGGTALVVRTSISGNHAYDGERVYGQGGGIYIGGGELYVTNCTIAGNLATGARARVTVYGGRVFGQNGLGGGVYAGGGKVVLAQCTIAENISLGGPPEYLVPEAGTGFGGGIYIGSGRVELQGTVIVGNEADRGKDVFGTHIDLGPNVLGAVNEELAGFDPSEILVFPANRGSTRLSYYDLPPRSPARDIVEVSSSDDILGQSRPVGRYGDAGSFEAAALAPFIISEIPERIVLTPGSSEVLPVEGAGTRKIKYELLRGQSVVQSGTNLVYTFRGADAAGLYTVRLSNVAGVVVSEPFEVVYNGRLTIAAQPQSKSVAPGGRMMFRVSVTGEGPISYQWFQGESELEGATNSILEIVDVRETDVGKYSVRVRNASEEVQSERATLSFWPLIFVTNLADSGAGSLRSAIDEANLTPDADMRRIVVMNPGKVEAKSPLVVRTRLEILSSGTTISGGGLTRLLRIATNAMARVSNVAFVNGRAPAGERGGAIWSEGKLELSHCSFSNNTAVLGGAIYSAGDLFLSGSAFAGNMARGENGESGNGPGGGGGGLGGAIYSAGGEVILTNVKMTGNAAIGGDGGTFITNSVVRGKGGNEGPIPIGTNNVPIGVGGGGGFTVPFISSGRPPFRGYQHRPGHPAGLGGGGGGAYGGNGCMVDCFYWYFGPGSTPGFGGGPAGDGPGGGGGAGLGGAVFVEEGSVQIYDSRIEANWAEGGAGKTNGLGIGGGIFVYGGSVTVGDSIVIENAADEGTDFYGNITSLGGNLFSTLPLNVHPSDRALAALSLVRANGVIELRWPANSQDLILERSIGGIDFEWEADPGIPRIEGEWHQLSITNSGAAEFFRLRAQ